MGRKAPPRRRVRLIHWKPAEARPRIDALTTAGYAVECAPFTPTTLREIAERAPAAVVIDLTRVPSHGRDVAVALRHTKRTRHIPLVLVGGDPEKVTRIRELLPDATYAEWSAVRSALRKAIAHPPERPHAPSSNLAGYSGTPLPQKLGIKEGMTVVLVDAPPGFEGTLGVLPDGVTLRRGGHAPRDLTIWCSTSRNQVDRRIESVAGDLQAGGLWIAWPKKASGVASDLTQNDVRRIGLAAGLVDFKICAIDETWSGLKFVKRSQKSGVRSQK
ncbi:MAG: hypothetical protein IH616_16120 [Gemmatimonadales bacterium]|nr:hypothetical protein [Gemmatimonadales bacterium]